MTRQISVYPYIRHLGIRHFSTGTSDIRESVNPSIRGTVLPSEILLEPLISVNPSNRQSVGQFYGLAV